MRCSNFILMTNQFIADWGAPYIRGVMTWIGSKYSALPIHRGNFSQNNARNTLITRPLGRYVGVFSEVCEHDDVIKWKHFPRNWPFVRWIHRSPVNSPHKGQWRGALMFSLICVWINDWVNDGEAGDLRRYRIHYDVTVMVTEALKSGLLCCDVSPCFCMTIVIQRWGSIQNADDHHIYYCCVMLSRVYIVYAPSQWKITLHCNHGRLSLPVRIHKTIPAYPNYDPIIINFDRLWPILCLMTSGFLEWRDCL